ncbi:MAG TPA: sialidase family protein [Candidatus Acidoferrum sp.]|nr:sialidase family protein [Candidatus Acidoferrum sp.]
MEYARGSGSTLSWISRWMKTSRSFRAAFAGALVIACVAVAFALPTTPAASVNVRVTLDDGTNGSYVSANQLAGGTYTDGVLSRCGTDRRQQNEPTLAIDPRNTSVWASGANEYCTVPTAGDAWAGFYRSTDFGSHWTDSLLPGYNGDTSSEGTSSPLAKLVAGGAVAAGDPVMGWDGNGNLFYMGNNFNRGIENGVSARFRDNTGVIWVATYEPSNPSETSTDGSKYVRTVILASNTFGEGSFNDKTNLAVDPVTGNVYAAWSDFHGAGCNEILFSRSTDQGASFSKPIKVSGGICGNQGPSIAIGPRGEVFIGWEAMTGGAFSKTPGAVTGVGFASSTNFGDTFSNAKIVMTYAPFISEQFSGNGARQCGDAPFNCPTGFTFPRFDLAGPYLAADNVNGTLVMAFQAAQASGQGQIVFMFSVDGGSTWSTPALLAASLTGHQFYPFLAASGGRVNAIWYDSQGDPTYASTRAPCNNTNGQTSACLNVRYAESTDGGKTWGSSIQVTNAPTNLNFEQFGGRLVPFFGDYITVAAQGDIIGASWTDQRNTVAAADASADNDGADVAGDPETGGTCTSSLSTCFDLTGGLDQNIYAATITP